MKQMMTKPHLLLELKQVCADARTCRYVPHGSNQLDNKHWRFRHKWSKAWKEEVFWAFKQVKYNAKLPFKKPDVTIELYSIRPMDKDNAYRSVKPIVDGLTEAGIIVDDSNDDINLEVKQLKVDKVKLQGVVVIIN